MAAPNHVLRTIKPKEKDFDSAEAIALCQEWLKAEAQKKCYNRNSKYETQCECLKFIDNEEYADVAESVSTYMVKWKGFNHMTQKEIVQK